MTISLPRSPRYRGKSPRQIVDFDYDFSSDWHVLQALSWLDYVTRTSNYNALNIDKPLASLIN